MTEKFVLVNLKGKKAKRLAETISNDTCRKILDYLSEKEEASASEISRNLNIPISTVNYNLKSLIQNKLIESKEFKWSPKGREMDLYKIARKFIILAPGRFEGLSEKLKTVIPVLLILAAIGFAFMFISQPDKLEETSLINKFSSVEELHTFLLNSEKNYEKLPNGEMAIPQVQSGVAGGAMSLPPKATEYSTTNIQVKGVDEADFVKNDDKYIYIIKDNKLVIIDAYPAREAKIISEIDLKGTPKSMFINGNGLVIFIEDTESGWNNVRTYSLIYDVSDRKKPVLVKEYNVDGNYFESRMVGNYVYLIAKENVRYDKNSVDVPEVRGSRGSITFGPMMGWIYYFDNPEGSYTFNTIVAFDIFNDLYYANSFMIGDSSNLYMSKNNIYLTYKKNFPMGYSQESEKEMDRTIVHKIHVEGHVDGIDIEYKGSGEVYGLVLNQFSMDEYDNHFRIATTLGHVRRGERGDEATNNIYVLDKNLNIVGKLEGLAPGEKIYSARFMGVKGYLVTFKKVDPLFVIDLSDHRNPKVLGKLKIPGYSDYLHPYDETHIIGIGKDTIESESGDFAWYQGIKMAFFDVSDVENPIELDKVVIGKRGSDSEVLRDYKAFLLDREKNILVLPVDELKEVKYYHNQKLYTTRDEMWRGAYVFRVDPSKGFELRGVISHSDEFDENDLYYWEGSSKTIKRSLFMDDVLYTISDVAVKMNNINVITHDINMIELE